jgi:DNA-binding transcriptional regulator YhcF (GntR family)
MEDQTKNRIGEEWMEELKQAKKKEFIDKAKSAGFTDEQAQFLWAEIQDKIFISANFGGLF